MLGNWLITSWGLRELLPAGGDGSAPGQVSPTRILDFDSAPLRALVAESIGMADSTGAGVLETAHGVIRDRVRPVYSIDDGRPASRTLVAGTGSCSQRLAILESVARAIGTPTRSRGLVLRGSFWFPRFHYLRPLIPDRVLLAWPEFLVDGEWRGASELFGEIGCGVKKGFTNRGAETLFEAIGRSAIDWDGVTSTVDGESCFDLSRHVVTDLGRFPSRDALFAHYGQTLCPPSRMLIDPILSRMAA
ncbi:MAG: hypothetical protein JWR36_142 [Glaciihabitans sp.]|jgi:hypothetical protein|nr:hypothetical protein [Glaciihabitans sp.]